MYNSFSNIADRIKYIRLLSKLSRAKINSELHISHNSLFSWESGKSVPNNSSIQNLVQAFRSIGIVCSTEWVQSGMGELPYKMDHLLTPSELHYLEVLSKQATFISYVNREEKFLFVNEKYGEIFNASPLDIIGKKLKDLIGDQSYMVCKPYVNQVLSGQEVVFEYPWQFKPGCFRYLKLRYIPDINDQKYIKGYYSFMDDTPIFLDSNNHAIFSSIPDITEVLPEIIDVPVTSLKYDHKLNLLAYELVFKLFNEYDIEYNYGTFKKVAENVYAHAINSDNKINHNYANSIIKTALAAGKLQCK
ncbi:hypothetical protein NOVO_01180 [Rickettsiales bacterium Ac37b]|nr:hypothetical protein NOVO_01180 [Rickettsiales bacterium Ac37b]